MKHILMVVDRIGWAYSTKAEALVNNYKGKNIKFELISTKEPFPKLKRAFAHSDLYLFFGFQNFKKCQRHAGAVANKSIVSVASHESWDHKQTQPNNQVLPDQQIINYLKQFKSVSAVSKRLVNLFKQAGLKEIYYTPNGVSINEFPPKFNLPKKPLICGYAGRDVDQKKGNRSIIIPAIRKCNYVRLNQALCDFKLEKRSGTRGKSNLKYNQMPKFYQNLHVYCCASREEGSCRSVLEAMSSGCAIISTDCGAINELIIHGHNGLIIDRNIEDFANAIFLLYKDRKLLNAMMIRNVEKIKEFDWPNIVHYWYKWIENNL